MPTYTERRDALKLRAMQQRYQFARLQIEFERREAQRWRLMYLQEAETRRTSIAAAEKAIRRLRKGRDNARAELAAAHAVGTHFAPRTFRCLYDELVWEESQLVVAPKYPDGPLRLFCPECGNDDLFEVEVQR